MGGRLDDHLQIMRPSNYEAYTRLGSDITSGKMFTQTTALGQRGD